MKPQYWLTLHWPLYEWRNTKTGKLDNRWTGQEDWFYYVYLTERFKRCGEQIQPGDGIFIYNTEGRPYLVTQYSSKGVNHVLGGRRLEENREDIVTRRKGIVALVWAIGRLENNPEWQSIVDPQGSPRLDFKYIVETRRDELPRKFVPLSTIRQCLNWPNGSPRNQLMSLTEAQFNCILRVFRDC